MAAVVDSGSGIVGRGWLSVPQGLKPRDRRGGMGTAEAVPLTSLRVSIFLRRPSPKHIQLSMILRTLGRSGLLVSPISLGTMTFGNKNWGSPDEVSEQILRTYLEAGGNFLDTADVYGGGGSETLLGRLIEEGKLRDRVVLATKSTFGAEKGNPLAGGNGRKHIRRSIERSLQRLRTDYIDLYWMHAWDTVTPVEEVVEVAGQREVRAGRILHYGFSDGPAWYAAKASTLAAAHGLPAPIALQVPYSLAERAIEQEHMDAARECGLGITPWSPLGAGFLTGKYSRDAEGKATAGGGRLDLQNQPFRMFTERNWKILDALRAVAAECGRPPAQVALAWVLAQRQVVSPIIGATKVQQLQESLGALELTLSAEQMAATEEGERPGFGGTYAIATANVGAMFFAGVAGGAAILAEAKVCSSERGAGPPPAAKDDKGEVWGDLIGALVHAGYPVVPAEAVVVQARPRAGPGRAARRLRPAPRCGGAWPRGTGSHP